MILKYYGLQTITLLGSGTKIYMSFCLQASLRRCGAVRYEWSEYSQSPTMTSVRFSLSLVFIQPLQSSRNEYARDIWTGSFRKG
jgi:hypothetical protein